MRAFDQLLENSTQSQIMVVGDLMLDAYWQGQSERVSPEAPVPVVRVTEQYARPGAAANVALNLAHLGVAVTLLGIVGDDDAADTLRSQLEAAKVRCLWLQVPGKSTIIKRRIIARHQQMLRLDHEQSWSQAEAAQLAILFEQHLSAIDAVIFSDYAKGSLLEVSRMIAMTKQQCIPSLVDPKGQDFSRYAGATILTPNLAEFQAVVGAVGSKDALVEQSQALMREHQISAVLVTRGAEGLSLVQPDHPPVHIPAEVREVFDVTGAGDTVIAMMGLAVASGMAMADAAEIANIAAGLVVKKLGTATLSLPELRCGVRRKYHGDLAAAVVDELTLIALVQESKLRNERIVMTNGCFDILHPGHLQYLQQAKQLGDRLIVAVNTDASIRLQKGPSRPVNPLADRMEMLSALSVVDWVVPFSELTPERLIASILPDCLVKGGDYQAEAVAGGSAVIANGGCVKILPFRAGYSTTRWLERLQMTPELLS